MFLGFEKQSEYKAALLDLTKRQSEILAIIQNADEISFNEIVEKMQNPPADRTIRYDLNRLKVLNLINSKGFGRGALWHALRKENETE